MRLAVLGSSPCHACTAACCRQNGHDHAVLLRTDAEVRRFAPWSTTAPLREPDGHISHRAVIAYRDGRCPFLGDDNLCTIYEDRPLACRAFECTTAFNAGGIGHHGEFLQLNPAVAALLERW